MVEVRGQQIAIAGWGSLISDVVCVREQQNRVRMLEAVHSSMHSDKATLYGRKLARENRRSEAGSGLAFMGQTAGVIGALHHSSGAQSECARLQRADYRQF